jgi:release factor glutamine methyltransferase
MTIKQALNQAKEQLNGIVPRAMFEVQLLMAHHLGVDRMYLIINDNQELQDSDGFFDLVSQRCSYKPIEYITKKVSFYDIELFVDEGVLIPRPETELLIDRCANIIQKHNITKIAEIGVGSGAISVVLARRFPHLQITATDISPQALSIAQQNIDSFNLTEQIELRHTSLLDGCDDSFELIVSNPPYIADNIILEPNVQGYEPHTALFGGEKGDELLKEIILQTKARDTRWLCCEMGYDQKEPLQKFMSQNGIYGAEFYKDLAGLDRGFVVDFEMLPCRS